MGFFSRIGDMFSSAVHRIGHINVHATLNRIGAIASAAHKVTSLANHVTGGAVGKASEALIGKGATNAIGSAGTYLARAYDTALMTKAAQGAHSNLQQTYGGGTGGTASAFNKNQ